MTDGNPRTGLTPEDLEAALASTGVGVWRWFLESATLLWTPEVYVVYGQDPAAFAVTFESWITCVHPEDREKVQQTVADALATASEDFFVQHRLICPDGEVRWTEGSGRCILDANSRVVGMTGVAVDVTRRVEALNALRENQEALQLFSELASDYVYAADLSEMTVAPRIVAGSFERTTGYTSEEVAALGGWFEVIAPEDRSSLMNMMATLEAGTPLVSEYRIRAKSGETRWLRDRVRPVIDPATKKLVSIIGGVQDITERKALERQLLQAQKMEPLARLAGGVAHDFNNLLTIIVSAASMLRANMGNVEQNLEDIMTASARAADLTRSLLTFGRQEIGAPSPITVRDLFAMTTPLITRLVGENIRLVISNEDDGATLFGDHSQLQMVLLNLAINARDSMPAGGSLGMRSRRLSVTPDDSRPAQLPAGTWVVLEVSDAGHGIAAEVLPHIFEPFFTTKNLGAGTGLGLATVHGIVHRLGGRIGVTSEVDHGTTFTVFLPEAEEVVRSGPPITTRYSIGGTEAILLVEDDVNVRDVTARYLADLGYQVSSVGSAEEALAMSSEELAGFALVLSDVRLPGAPGTELARFLAEHHPRTRVLLISGYVEDEAQRLAIEVNHFAFERKPFSPDVMARRIRELISERDPASLGEASDPS